MTALHIALRILTAHPSSTQLGPHSIAPHNLPHSSRAGCVCSSELTDLGPDSPPVSHWFSILNESLSVKACQCPQLHPRADDRVTSRDLLRHRWDKTWKIWESMSQTGSASSPFRFFLLPFSYLMRTHCPFRIHCAWVSVCVSVSVLTL